MKLKTLLDQVDIHEAYDRKEQVKQMRIVAKQIADDIIDKGKELTSDKSDKRIVETNIGDLMAEILESIERSGWELDSFDPYDTSE